MTLKEKVLQAASGEKLPAGVQIVSGTLWIEGLTHAKTSFLELDPDLHEDHVIWRMAALALGIRDDMDDFKKNILKGVDVPDEAWKGDKDAPRISDELATLLEINEATEQQENEDDNESNGI